MTTASFPKPTPFGRILFLSSRPGAIAAQLDGCKLRLSDALPLRDDISTDEITPMPVLAHYDEKLGRYPYTGVQANNETPIGPDAILNGGFEVTVSGKRYGKGSSREHSPAAEKLAGIRLVIAESFERLYRQNADNIGLITSTDFGLIERIQNGEAISLEELVKDREALAANILACGGLLHFGRKHMEHVVSVTPSSSKKPQTLFEKIVARHMLETEHARFTTTPGAGIFIRADWRFIHEYYTGMCAHMLHSTFGRPVILRDKESIVAFEDHTSYINTSVAHVSRGLVPNILRMCEAHRDFVADYNLRSHRTLSESEVAHSDGGNVAGISHAMMSEHYALPGQVVVGTDSHTPHSGALGCAAFGVGTTDMANAFVTGAVRLTVPESLLIRLDGTLPAGITAKDIVLELLARPEIRSGLGIGKVFEFAGPAIESLSIDERATLTNMTAELGGLTGIVAPDQETIRFLRERRGVEFPIEPWMHSDPDAHYAASLHIDCEQISPMIARPGDPGNGLSIRDLREHVAIDIAYGGSCTAGKRADFDHYHAVLAWGLEHGLRIPPTVTLYLQYGTTAVRDYCIGRGYDRVFSAMGARMLEPSCGACANCGPGSSSRADQVTVSAINRNFTGRSGPGKVWLASPPTVAASALAGELISFEELQKRAATRNAAPRP
ncbi:3-isopropylmalate dehydratase [Paralcaligenes sp. KSB-10]|uniref:aconitase family protein n=1 Tax=Paralcaligenes sp. KSB-10 TaxID=2901142 RepID=UPI001E3E8017|nr:aconitase family protein [Paralcaligenes sp. KSB-10]UHL64427.1 3-isopropylmalate dehydratase [Paralcaligenes sp. KSB-10]